MILQRKILAHLVRLEPQSFFHLSDQVSSESVLIHRLLAISQALDVGKRSRQSGFIGEHNGVGHQISVKPKLVVKIRKIYH